MRTLASPFCTDILGSQGMDATDFGQQVDIFTLTFPPKHHHDILNQNTVDYLRIFPPPPSIAVEIGPSIHGSQRMTHISSSVAQNLDLSNT